MMAIDPEARDLDGQPRGTYDKQGNWTPDPRPTTAAAKAVLDGYAQLAIQSQGRMRKPRRADQDENLRNDVAGMIADMCLPAEVLGPRLMDGAHQIVVVVRERVLREIESYARENIR